MNSFLKSAFLSVIFLLLFTSIVFPQSNDFTKPGPKGIFVFLGKNIPCGKIISSYKIDRRENNGDWKQIAEVKAPVSLSEFITHTKEAKNLIPSQPLPSQKKLEQLFDRAMLYGTTDSLKGFSLQYTIKIGLGLIYYDAQAVTGTAIQYRITELNASGQKQSPLVSNPINMPYKVAFDEIKLSESSRTEKAVYIRWKSTGNNPSPLFSVYRYENQKPVNGGGSISHYSINDTTYYVFQDSLTPSQSQQELKYFLSPYDQLGNTGNSSQVVVITNDNFSKASFIRVQAKKIDEKMATRLSWHFTDPVAVKNIEVYRSNSSDKGFMKIASLTRDDTVYIDERLQFDQAYYYLIQANSIKGNRFKQSNIIFAPAYNPEKPDAPGILSATGIERGVKLLITISDPKAAGIRVFRNDGINDALMVISDLIPRKDSSWVIFLDTSNTLSGTRTYTYAVRAENSSNIASDLSSTVTAKPIMNNNPQPPAFFKAYQEDGMVKLYWENMMMTDSLIVGYIVYRRNDNGNEIHPLPFSPIAGNQKPYASCFLFDSAVVAGNTYTYAVHSVDFDNNRSLQRSEVTISFQELKPVAPSGLILTILPEGIKVSWHESQYPGMHLYKLYRYLKGEAPELLGTFPPETTEFIDETVKNRQAYFYFLTTCNKKGAESAHSEEVGIKP